MKKKAEETGGVRVKSKRFEEGETSKKKKKKMKSNNDEDTVPVFNITIKTSYLKFLVRLKTKNLHKQNSISTFSDDFFLFSQSQRTLLTCISRKRLRWSPFTTPMGTVHGRWFAW